MVACVASFALAVGVACGDAALLEPRPDIVIIVVDTLRADRVGAQRNGQSLTPFLDSLAERAVVFRNAYAPSPWTNPSVASLLTSRFQSQHGIVWFDTVLSESERTLPEILRGQGYASAGFVANPLLRAKNGFDQGFEVLRTLSPRKTAGESREWYARAKSVNDAALSWLDRLQERSPVPPFFLYLHYMEPHHPLQPPENYLDEVLGDRPRPDVGRINEALRNQKNRPIDAAMLPSIRDAYDAEVMSLDARLAALFQALEERGVLSHTIVVVTADHGEELLERGFVGHHQALYEESIRVPLLILAAAMGGAEEVTAPVSLLDVAPTVLELAGIARPDSFEGYSLHPGGREEARPYAVSELVRIEIIPYRSPHETAVIGDGAKLILGVEGQREFYDLAGDPGESDPNALGEAERSELAARAERVSALAPEVPVPPDIRELDAKTLKQLEALGYRRGTARDRAPEATR